MVTDSGGGYTWAGNSRENKLTVWSNDPTTDEPSEILYIRDEETGAYWTPTPLPIRDKAEYRIQHGRGFTRFTHSAHGIRADLLLSIAADDCIKFVCLKLRNETNRAAIALGNVFCGVGAGRLARHDAHARLHRTRRGHRRGLRAQQLP